MRYDQIILNHYIKNWENNPKNYKWIKGPINDLPPEFKVYEFEPSKSRDMWTYATCCMSQESDIEKIELHLFSRKQDTMLVELLTAIAHFHRTEKKLNLNHTVNFGKAWQDNSLCTHGFISLPYLDGPELENCLCENNQVVKCYWLIPITLSELEYKKKNGHEALEELFEKKQFNYLDSNRKSLV